MTDGWEEIANPRRAFWDDPHPVRGDVVVRVRRAHVPALVLHRVQLRCEKERSLGPLERLALGVAARHGSVSAADLRVVTGLVETVGELLLARLVNGELLALDAGAWTLTSAGRVALARPTVVETRTETLPCVVLPRTGDVLPGTRGGLVDAMRRKPDVEAPVPPELRAVAPPDFVRAALTEHRERFPPDCVDVTSVQDTTTFPERCGAWTVEGEIAVTAGREIARLRFTGANGNSHGVNLEVPTRLVAAWKALAGGYSDVAWWRDALTALTGARPADFTLEARGACAWELGVPGEQVRALARAGLSLEAARTLVLASDAAEVAVSVHFRPTDAVGAAAFLLDGIAARVAEGMPNTSNAHVQVAHMLEVDTSALPTPEVVRQRLWQLGEYPAVYALREPEDFPRD